MIVPSSPAAPPNHVPWFYIALGCMCLHASCIFGVICLRVATLIARLGDLSCGLGGFECFKCFKLLLLHRIGILDVCKCVRGVSVLA